MRSFATTSSLDLAESQFEGLDLNDYRAFRMFIIDQKGNNRLLFGMDILQELSVTSQRLNLLRQ